MTATIAPALRVEAAAAILHLHGGKLQVMAARVLERAAEDWDTVGPEAAEAVLDLADAVIGGTR